MPKLEILSEQQREMLLNWPCPENEDSPWTAMSKSLSECKVALVTTAGLHVRGDKPFTTAKNGGDASFRVIPRLTDPADIVQSHTSIGFDRTSIYKDINITFPIDRLNELVALGKIGSLSDNYYSFMGALRNPAALTDEYGPEVAKNLMAEGVDVVLLIPT